MKLGSKFNKIGDVNDMKKWLLITIAAILLVAMVVTLSIVIVKEKLPKGVAAQVNGVNITKEQVAQVLEFNEIQIEGFTRVLQQTLNDKQEIQKYITQFSQQFPTTQQEVITHLIQGEAVCQQLKAKGTLLSVENAEASFNEEFALLQTDESQKAFYETLQQVIKEKEKTMEDYVALGKAQSYVFYNMKLAKQTFKTDGSYDESSALSLDGQFNKYLEELVAAAQVKKAR